MLDFDRNDPGDLQDFVRFLFNICLWIFVIGVFIIMAYAIFGNGDLPSEPKFWLSIVTWLFGN